MADEHPQKTENLNPPAGNGNGETLPWWRTARFFGLGLAALAVLGAVLRLWGWPAQALLDDEWHALDFVLGKTFLGVLLFQGMGANSIPVNIYSWVLLHTVGWSEPLLRLPSTLAGIAALVLLPLLAARLWGRTVALVFAALLAMAPVTIFYSRVARPYAPVMLLAAASVLLTLLWLRDHRRRDVVLAALCGVGAIYYHLYAVIPVGLALAVASGYVLAHRWKWVRQPMPPLADVWLAGGLMAVLGGLLVVLPNLLDPWWMHGIHGVDRATADTAFTVLGLFAGTPVLALQVLLGGLALLGWLWILVQSRPLGLALGVPFAGFALAMALSTQDGAHAGIQVARYGIAFFPLAYLLVAAALAAAARGVARCLPERARLPVAVLAAAALAAPYLATSPLWTTYQHPNNFTNHSAYQYRYEPINWELSPERDLVPGYRMSSADIPPLYRGKIASLGIRGVIEYPMLIGDHLNLHYFSQHDHRYPVRLGYVDTVRFSPLSSEDKWVFDDTPIDYVLSRIPPGLRRNCRWYSMADLSDADKLRRTYPGWLVVVHRNLLRETFPSQFGPKTKDHPLALSVARRLYDALGPPVYRDTHIAAWVVR
ncbi:MAG: glycosyltransferase family 39 protein [Lentisphaeria bacterium]